MTDYPEFLNNNIIKKNVEFNSKNIKWTELARSST